MQRDSDTISECLPTMAAATHCGSTIVILRVVRCSRPASRGSSASSKRCTCHDQQSCSPFATSNTACDDMCATSLTPGLLYSRWSNLMSLLQKQLMARRYSCSSLRWSKDELCQARGKGGLTCRRDVIPGCLTAADNFCCLRALAVMLRGGQIPSVPLTEEGKMYSAYSCASWCQMFP